MTKGLAKVKAISVSECFGKQLGVTATRFPLNDFRSFNSPFEVLFNFPSGYLFAIDLSPIFSHGWRLPPYLRSTPKERDSVDQCRTQSNFIKDRAITFSGMPFQAPRRKTLLAK